MTLVQVGAFSIAGIAAVRGNLIAAFILALFGAYRVALFGLAIVRVLDGTAAQINWGPGWVLAAAIALPFAILWMRGGLAAIYVHREPSGSIPVDAI